MFQESQIFTAIVIAAIVGACIISCFIISVVKQHKKVLAMQRQNADAEITSLEKDRARVAEDLHNEISSMLSAVKMRISSFDLSDPADEIQLEKTNHAIDEMARRLREISFALMPSTLLRHGLVSALQELVRFSNRKDGLTIRLLYPAEPFALNKEKSIHVYRTVQEIIQNTLKHAKATELVIELQIRERRLLLLSRDNGLGFNYRTELKEATGLGLRSLQNRISLLHGNFTIQSDRDGGTFYKIEIPLENE